jgi:hypothetical protein
MAKIAAVLSLLLLFMAGCYEVTEDNSKEVAAGLASEKPESFLTFNTDMGTGSLPPVNELNAYSYNSFIYSEDPIFHGYTGWHISFGYEADGERNVDILIVSDTGNIPDGTYNNTNPGFKIRIWLYTPAQNYSCNIKPADTVDPFHSHTFTLTITHPDPADNTKIHGVLSGILVHDYEGSDNHFYFDGSFDASVRPR